MIPKGQKWIIAWEELTKKNGKKMMLWAEIIALAAIGQVIVIALGAVVAYFQLVGLRRQHEATLIQDVFEKLNSVEFARALAFVYDDLPHRLREPAYVREITEGRATASSHPELSVMHFFNALGLMVHLKMVSEHCIVPFIASPCMRAWDHLAPVIGLMRRRYPHAYSPLESLVARSRATDLDAINARFRSQTPGLRMQWERTARELTDQLNETPQGKQRFAEDPKVNSPLS